MSDSNPMAQAAMRLEAAVERLARAISARLHGGEGGIPPERLAALAERLDEVILRLRDALGEEGEEADPARPPAGERP